jgi:hypothetical protein
MGQPRALEVLLRNRMHEALTAAYGLDWYNQTAVGLDDQHVKQVSELEKKLIREKKPVSPGRIIGGLSFGFWTSMYTKGYNDLWLDQFHVIFKTPSSGLQRKAVQSNLNSVRDLRNRMAHHEPLLHPGLVQKHEDILAIVGWMCPETEQWVRAHSQFMDLWRTPENPYY